MARVPAPERTYKAVQYLTGPKTKGKSPLEVFESAVSRFYDFNNMTLAQAAAVQSGLKSGERLYLVVVKA